MDGIVYRPPFEAQSLLLEVTKGCSHNGCSFCTMYRDVPFSVRSPEQIGAEIDEAARLRPDTTRVFLENGDPFVLPAERLLRIADRIHSRFSSVETISMYASIPNIRTKTDEELRLLRQAGFNELNIGVESGLDAALVRMNKGYTAREAEKQCMRLKEAGFDYGANIILGCAGAARCRENAETSADLLNTIQPYLIFLGTLHAEPGCSLHEDIDQGSFRECSFGQLLLEQEILLTRLNQESALLICTHPSNVALTEGILPRDREAMLEEVRSAREILSDRLTEIPLRGPEGMVLNGLPV
ncbi:MAG: radical SAM protein [Clostridia bacterium]|nr:radical SAM protein [Clostridia bacterium]